jgi:hypothetical protein
LHKNIEAVNYLASAQALFRCPYLRSNLCVFLYRSRNQTLISLGGENPFGKEGTLWPPEFGFMTDLEWDFGEWFWGGPGTKISVPFY